MIGEGRQSHEALGWPMPVTFVSGCAHCGGQREKYEERRQATFQQAKNHGIIGISTNLSGMAPSMNINIAASIETATDGLDQEARKLVAEHAELTIAAQMGKPEWLADLTQKVDPRLFTKTPLLAACATLRQAECRTPLMWAAMSASAARVKILAPVSDAREQDDHGNSALMLLLQNVRQKSKKQALECLREILPLSEVNARAKNGDTALKIAVWGENKDAARLLLEAGADAKILLDDGRTLLMEVATWADKKWVELLLPHSNIFAVGPKGETALARSVMQRNNGIRGARACAKLLLERSDPTVLLERKTTLLMLAGADFLPMLLPRVDAKALDEDGHSALFHAITRGDAPAVKLLLPHSDSVALASMRDPEDGLGPLSLAACADRSGECARLLLPFCDPLAVEKRGRTALANAAATGCVEAIRHLLPVSDANRLDTQGYSALGLALKNGEFEAAAELLPWSDPQAGVAFAPKPKERDNLAEAIAKFMPTGGRGVSDMSMASSGENKPATQDTRPWAVAIDRMRFAGDEEAWAGVELMAAAIPMDRALEMAKERRADVQKNAPKLFARVEAQELRSAMPGDEGLAANIPSARTVDGETPAAGLATPSKKRRPKSL